MNNKFIQSTLFFALLLSVTNCTTKNQLKAMLVENPDILVEAFQKNPDKFSPIFNQARAQAQARNVEAENAKREEDFKNPKQPLVDTKRPIKGKVNAPVTIVAYSDFQCPFCSRVEDTMAELMKKNEGKIRYVFKNFPLPFHQYAMPAALRYEAISMQSKELALKYHDELFKNQNLMNTEKEAYLDKAAAKIGANVAKMKKDIATDAVKKRVEADIEEGKKFGVTGTPAFLINGVFINGARGVQDFDAIVQRWLKNPPTREVSSDKK